MTEQLIAVEVNCATGEEISRPLTAEEIADKEIRAENFAEEESKREAEAQAKAEAKASAEAKLSALGLTTEEIAALTK